MKKIRKIISDFGRKRGNEKENERVIRKKNKVKELRYLLDEAYQQMQQEHFRYAICDASCVMKEAVKLMLRWKNDGDISDDLLVNLKICERRKLFGRNKDFICRLYEVYCICECGEKELYKEKYLNYRKVYFVIMQLKDFLNFLEKQIEFYE